MLFRYNKYKLSLLKQCFYSSNSNIYSNTVLLPKTKFPLRLENQKLVQRDEAIQKVAAFSELYEWQKGNLSEPEFVLHDGPPYANGSPHMGHAINKILKDTILRYKIINGNKVHYIPGWDCHGLPIELKALTEGEAKSPIEIREKAKEFAEKTINTQKKIFQSWGVLGDWKNHYATFSNDYVKNQLRLFYKLYEKGLIYRDYKPIYWSPSSRTALAEAELEYNDSHKSKSVYLRIELKDLPKLDLLKDQKVYALIWTTTPWTLPSNQAICYNNQLKYSAIKKTHSPEIYLVASKLVEEISKIMNCNFEVLEEFSGVFLSKTTYVHPIYKDRICKFYHSGHASDSKGTGLVHTAPAHGPDDFLVALNNNMSVIDLVNEKGCYSSAAGKNLEGLSVLDQGVDQVLKTIKNDVMFEYVYIHSYPYDWRTKKPVIVRASKQWFINTEAVKDRAIELLDSVKFIPNNKSEVYKKTLVNQLKKRPYWCISRQRKWGVPIPVFYTKNQTEIIINDDMIHHNCDLIDKHGQNYWWKCSMEDLVPENVLSERNLHDIEKGEDILDIWFDSGISWSKVLEDRKVADLYLEGVDQFTGWFQSSLVTSVALRDKAPFKSIYVHGFAVDENGTKMSKSLGNVIDPLDIVKGGKKFKTFGVDTLRWWVASRANQDSMTNVSVSVLQLCADEVQKIRNTLRFSIASLFDYDTNFAEFDNLLLIDKYMLHLLDDFDRQTKEAIDDYEFQKICKNVINLLTNQISAFYYSSVKDRLYCEDSENGTRKSAQFVLYQILTVLAKSVGPILPHLAEEMFLYLPLGDGKTYFTSKHSISMGKWKNEEIENVMETLLKIRHEINKNAQPNTLSTIVDLSFSKEVKSKIEKVVSFPNLEHQLTDIFQVSEVFIKPELSQKEFEINLRKSEKHACVRCRKINSEKEKDLCVRCHLLVGNEKKKVAL